jgi:hypothetical protein
MNLDHDSDVLKGQYPNAQSGGFSDRVREVIFFD